MAKVKPKKRAMRTALTVFLTLALTMSLCPIPRMALAEDQMSPVDEEEVITIATDADEEESVDNNVVVEAQEESIDEEVGTTDETPSDQTSPAAPAPSVFLQSDAGLPSKFDLRDRGVELDAEEHFHKQPLCKSGNYALWQDNIDQINGALRGPRCFGGRNHQRRDP